MTKSAFFIEYTNLTDSYFITDCIKINNYLFLCIEINSLKQKERLCYNLFVLVENSLEGHAMGYHPLELHDKGFNCAQSVFCALRDITGLSEETSLAIAGGFGGGMRAAEVCGAVSGAVMALGAAFPFTEVGDEKAKAKIASATREFHKRFKQEHQSLICRELLGYDIEEGMKAEVNREICPALIEDAVRIAREIMAEYAKE
jgi:C_GCAxxG_C_C family probable redox protein